MKITQLANGHGVNDEGSIDDTNKTIDSKVNFAAVFAGVWRTCREEAGKHYCISHRSVHLQRKDSEAPKPNPVPGHRASRHAWIDIR